MSKTRDILQLYSDGLSKSDIARQLDCSRANVTLTIQRHLAWDHHVSMLPDEHIVWLLERAKKIRQPPREMAARLLMEIIDQYRNGDV